MRKITFTDKVGNKVVSSLILYMVSLPSRNLAVIEEVKTEKKYRKQGRATKLIIKAIETAIKNDCDCVELTVREDKPNIQRFYKFFGFFDRKNRAFRLDLKK